MTKNRRKTRLVQLVGIFAVACSLLLAACGSSNSGPADTVPINGGNDPGNGDQNGDENGSGNGPGNGDDGYDYSYEHADCLTTGGAIHADMPAFYVNDGVLYDGFGEAFVMRGVNYPYAWFRHRNNEQEFADIASTCANSIRVVLANGEQWGRVPGAEVADIIRWAKDNNLVAILEVHDATGWPESSGAGHPQTAVDYWLSDDIRAAIDGNEGYVIINIANEPLGNFSSFNQDYSNWVEFHVEAIEQLRAAGLQHVLIVDAPNWGQDWRNVMRNGAGALEIAAADPQGDVVFSVHMYDVYGTEASVQNYFNTFLETGLPLIVGEFAADHGNSGNVAEQAILQYSQELDIGWLAWSWSGNTTQGGLDSLDMVQNFNPANPSPWGRVALFTQNGIAATSRLCTCFMDN